MDRERFIRGCETINRLDGETRAIPDMDEMDPLSAYIREYAYGEIYNREGLCLRERLIATVSAVAAIGGCDGLLKTHMTRALKNGFTKKDLEEILLQVSLYAGFPRAVTARYVLDEIEG